MPNSESQLHKEDLNIHSRIELTLLWGKSQMNYSLNVYCSMFTAFGLLLKWLCNQQKTYQNYNRIVSSRRLGCMACYSIEGVENQTSVM